MGNDGNNRKNSHKVASSVAARVFVASLIVQKFFPFFFYQLADMQPFYL